MNISRREFSSLVDTWYVFVKILRKRGIVYKFLYRNPKLRLDLQEQKTISILITITISIKSQIDNFVRSSDLETTIPASFPLKTLNYTVINLFLQTYSTLAIANSSTYRKTDITLQTSVKCFRASRTCSEFTSDSRYDNSIIKVIGKVYCPDTMCSDIFCFHKKTFKSLSRSNYQCPQYSSMYQVRNILFDEQTKSFLVEVFSRVIYF